MMSHRYNHFNQHHSIRQTAAIVLTAFFLVFCCAGRADVYPVPDSTDMDAVPVEPEIAVEPETPVEPDAPVAPDTSAASETLIEPETLTETETAPVAAGPLETAIVEGYGAVIDNDIAAARDSALADARRRAIEQVAGVKLFSSTEISGGIMLRDDVTVETSGLVIDSHILEEGMFQDGLYRVLAEVMVATDPLQAAMFRFSPRDRIALFVTAETDSISSAAINERLTTRLINAGYSVIDPERATPEEHRDTWNAYQQGAMHELPLLAQSWNTPSLLNCVVRHNTPEHGPLGYAVRGELEMTLIAPHSGRILSRLPFGEPVTGFGRTPELVLADLAGKLAQRAETAVVETLIPDAAGTIRLRVRGLTSDRHYREFVNQVLAIRFVQDVRTVDALNTYMTRFDIVTDADATVIANELKRLENVVVPAITENELEVAFENE
jgi:hypothetical protein